MLNYQGICKDAKNLPGQVEFNRRKNVEQDQRLATLNNQVQQILNQAPSGFLPKVYYGLTQGPEKYRFIDGYVFNATGLQGNDGDAYELVSPVETEAYVTAIAVQLNNTQAQIIIRGDYNINTSSFTLINMRTGSTQNIALTNPMSLQPASYLGSYDANNNKDKQITVLYDLEINKTNIVFASVDYSGDGVYNWVRVGSYIDGVDGKSIYTIDNLTVDNIMDNINIGDSVIAAEVVQYNGTTFQIGDVKSILTLDPVTFEDKGNIRGQRGETGATGATGQNGTDGHTPYIQDNRWYINGVDTGVVAIGQNGTDGENGQAFSIQSGLYSVPANYGQINNEGPNGEVLQQLPTLPQTNISGKGYVVYDPLTTPLSPYYDLYYANNGDSTWTIIHPFSGLQGQNGADGATPYIQNGNWYINGNNTGVSATGPQGIQGPKGEKGINPMGTWVANNKYFVDDVVTYKGSVYICIQDHTGIETPPNSDTMRWALFVSKGDTGAQGPTGQTGATPNITVNATQLDANKQPTATVSGTTDNPIITFGIPQRDSLPGMIVAYAGTNAPSGWKVCDGSTFDTNTYGTLYYILGTNKVPDLRDRFIQGGAVGDTNLRTAIPAGLPNITGTFIKAAWFAQGGQDGAFANAGLKESKTTAFNNSSGNSAGINFNASRSSSIYGKSNTVQPPAYKLLYIICMGPIGPIT